MGCWLPDLDRPDKRRGALSSAPRSYSSRNDDGTGAGGGGGGGDSHDDDDAADDSDDADAADDDGDCCGRCQGHQHDIIQTPDPLSETPAPPQTLNSKPTFESSAPN